MNKKILALVATSMVLTIAAYVGSPFWAARQLKAAALSGDVDRLNAAIDFPAVRQSLKSQMTIALTAKMQNDPAMRDNPFAGLGMMMMPAIIDRMVDGFVTPEGMSALVSQGKMKKEEAKPETSPSVGYRYDYRNLDHFAVSVTAPGLKDVNAPVFVLERRGFLNWRMIRLELPDGALDGKAR